MVVCRCLLGSLGLLGWLIDEWEAEQLSPTLRVFTEELIEPNNGLDRSLEVLIKACFTRDFLNGYRDLDSEVVSSLKSIEVEIGGTSFTMIVFLAHLSKELLLAVLGVVLQHVEVDVVDLELDIVMDLLGGAPITHL